MVQAPTLPGFECCYCHAQITSAADLVSPCESGPGGWHYAEPPLLDPWVDAAGNWAPWD
jgi:hypothetical protein